SLVPYTTLFRSPVLARVSLSEGPHRSRNTRGRRPARLRFGRGGPCGSSRSLLTTGLDARSGEIGLRRVHGPVLPHRRPAHLGLVETCRYDGHSDLITQGVVDDGSEDDVGLGGR